MIERARLRIHGEGGFEVTYVEACLRDLTNAYNSILFFENLFDEISGGKGWYGLALGPFWRFGIGGRSRVDGSSFPVADDIAPFLPYSEQIILHSVYLKSPGAWEFLGTLNPLEVLRKYLNDRHERRKDREYRENAERRQLELENMERESKVIASRIRLAREMGANETQINAIVRHLIFDPLEKLGRHQDKGLIGKAELLDPPEGASAKTKV